MPHSSALLQHWPGVWRADELASAAGGVVSSGHALLDAQLPGGGWPLGALIDLMANAPEAPWSALLSPALAAQARVRPGTLALVQPPHEPCLPALAAAGLVPERVLWLRARTPSERLWLTEQALGCAGVASVLAWLPGARPADWRRLHLAAARRAEVLFFALRPRGGAGVAVCAPLALAFGLAHEPGAAGNPADNGRVQLRVDILRRRGPPLLGPLWLPAWNARLEAVLALEPSRLPAAESEATVLSFRPPAARVAWSDGHALDRLALAV